MANNNEEKKRKYWPLHPRRNEKQERTRIHIIVILKKFQGTSKEKTEIMRTKKIRYT